MRGSRRSLFLSGFAIALAAWLREPMLIFAAALGALTCFATPNQRLRAGAIFGAGLAIGLLPLALFQWLALGDPLGFHVAQAFPTRADGGSVFGLHLRARPTVIHNLFLAADGSRTLSALLNLPFALLLIARPRFSARVHPGVALAAAAWALVGVAVSLIGYATAPSPIERLLASNGFFAAAPLLVVGLVRRRPENEMAPGDRVVDWLLRLAFGYALLYCALTPLLTTTGIHWGSRYQMELYPLLAVPCAAGLLALRRGPASLRGATLLLGLLAAGSVALQVFSIDLLRRKLVFGERLAQAVREAPEPVIVTDAWWVPQTLAHEFFRKSIFVISTPEQSRILLERLARSGSGPFLFVTPDAGRPPDPRARVIEDEGLGFFSLRIERHTLPLR